MKSSRSLQALEFLLILALVYGIVEEIRDPQWPRLVGIAFNLLWQYAVLLAVRRQRNDSKLGPAEQTALVNQQRATMKPLLIGCGSLAVILMINVGLVVANVYTYRTFAFIVTFAAAVTFCYVLISFNRLQKRHR